MDKRIISTKYGHTSRGKCWGKWFPGKSGPNGDFVWCDKDGGRLIVPEGPGHLLYGSDDGYRRRERESITYAD